MSVTPQFIGQVYKDTNTGNIWRANSTTTGDWTLEVQNMQVKWEPKNLKLGELAGFIANYDNPTALVGVGSLVFDQASFVQQINIAYAEELTSISFPNLVSQTAEFIVSNCSIVASILLPLLVTCESGLKLFDLPSLVSLSLPSFVPTDSAEYWFHDNGLDAASVNGLLARLVAEPTYVSGSVKLEGGTNAAPSGQGILDVATLTGRGVTVTTN